MQGKDCIEIFKTKLTFPKYGRPFYGSLDKERLTCTNMCSIVYLLT